MSLEIEQAALAIRPAIGMRAPHRGLMRVALLAVALLAGCGRQQAPHTGANRAVDRVLDVRRDSGNLVVTIGPVDLTEIVREAHIHITDMPIDFSEPVPDVTKLI